MKNPILKLFSGSSIVFIIPIIILPFLLNYFTAEQFGEETILMSFAFIISNVLNLKYDQAILIAEKNEVQKLFNNSIILTFCFSITLYFVLLLIKSYIKLDFSFITYLLIAINLLQILSSLYLVANRLLLIREMNLLKIIPVIFFSFFSIMLIFNDLYEIDNALVLSRLFSLSFSVLLGIYVLNKKLNFKLIKIEFDTNTFRKYKEYPLKILPGKLLNLISTRSLEIILLNISGLKTVGLFSIAKKITSLPENILGLSLGSYLRRYFYYNDILRSQRIILIIKKYFSKILMLTFAALILIYPNLEFIFSFVLSKNSWFESIYMIQILTFGYVISFIISPFSSLLRILKEEKMELIFQAIFFSTLIIGFLSFYFLDIDDSLFISFISIQRGVVFCLLGVFIVKSLIKLKLNEKKL